MIEIYNLNMFKCVLCEEVILAEHKSSSCPFCGAHDDYIIRVKDWSEKKDSKELSKDTIENLEKALDIGLENACFYRCAVSHAQDLARKSIFQSFLRIKMQHVLLISKLLKKPNPNPILQDICFRLDYENIKDSFNRETKAKEFYEKVYNDATEPRIKEVFFGLIEAEGDHIELLKERM